MMNNYFFCFLLLLLLLFYGLLIIVQLSNDNDALAVNTMRRGCRVLVIALNCAFRSPCRNGGESRDLQVLSYSAASDRRDRNSSIRVPEALWTALLQLLHTMTV